MKLSKNFVSPESSGLYSPLMIDYLKGREELSSFYFKAPQRDSFHDAIRARETFKIDRVQLVKSLEEQYKAASIPLEGLVKSNIQALAQSTTFTICSGHQPALFLGPLYTVYKIVSSINLAKQVTLDSKGKHQVVPVFWLASEDHDFAELNHTRILNTDLRIENPPMNASGRMPFGHLSSDVLKELLNVLHSILPSNADSQELHTFLTQAYDGTASIAQATRKLLHHLFASTGLVILDGDDAFLKKLLSPVLADDFKNKSGYLKVSESTEKLNHLGYSTQVKPSEVNSFYFKNGLRQKISRQNDQFSVFDMEGKFSITDMMEKSKSNPELFSPNVTLRPLYQEMILPNLAFVGGPGELSYWLQYKSMFEHYSVPFPLLMPRNSVLWINERQNNSMQKLGIEIPDLLNGADAFIKKYMLSKQGSESSFDSELQQIFKVFDSMSEKAEKIDATLKQSILGEKARFEKSMDNIASKVLRAEKRKEETSISKITSLFEKLFPNGKPQERTENWITFYSEYGPAFIQALLENLDPFALGLTVIRVEEG